MKKLFNMYMDLPMSVVVGAGITTWLTLGVIVLSPAILFYGVAWCVVLIPFLGSIAYTEHKHKMKKLRVVHLREIKEDLGEK